MKRITVNLDNPYEVLVGKGILENIKPALDKASLCIVTDSNVSLLHLQALLQAVGAATDNNSVFVFEFPAGENSKNMETVNALLLFMAEHNMQRSDMLIALGGGVTGDIAGFAASIYMRGIRYIQVPTSLLAMVDSSVGGKTAVNLTAGKNLAGTFWQPSMVICDTAFLDTLPKENYQEGIAEIVKYGAICDSRLFEDIKNRKVNLQGEGCRLCNEEEIISRCIEIKAEIVAADERESGRRAILNFGHTVGHVIERMSGFSISHGKAVAMGMIIITRIACENGLSDEDYSLEIKNKLFELDVINDAELAEGIKCFGEDIKAAGCQSRTDYLSHDKKCEGGSISLILLEKIGKAKIKKVSVKDLETFAGKSLSEGN